MKFSLSSLAVLMMLLLAACGGEDGGGELSDGVGNGDRSGKVGTITDPLLIEITQLEEKTKVDTAFDRTRALRLFKAYQDYYNQHPKDTVAGNYLFEAANLAQKLNKHQRAVDLFINFHDGFPKSDRADEAVYNIAYIYDARIGDKKKAAEYYNKVIELYPQSMWATQAQAALQIVNMSDEELLKYLREKNQK